MQEATSLRANSPVVIHSSDICVIITFIFCNYRVEKVFVFVYYVVYYLTVVIVKKTTKKYGGWPTFKNNIK